MKNFTTNLVPGFLIASLASAVTTPLDTLKTRVQSQGLKDYLIIEGLKTIYDREGLKGLLYGVQWRVLKNSIHTSLYLFIYEWYMRSIVNNDWLITSNTLIIIPLGSSAFYHLFLNCINLTVKPELPIGSHYSWNLRKSGISERKFLWQIIILIKESSIIDILPKLFQNIIFQRNIFLWVLNSGSAQNLEPLPPCCYFCLCLYC